MATKLSEKVENALTVLFTSVAAPILVGLANHVINDGAKEVARGGEPSAPASAPLAAARPAPIAPSAASVPPVFAFLPTTAPIVLDEVAVTRAEAVRLAKRDALVRIVSAQVDPIVWSNQSTTLTAILVRDEATLITDCREVAGRTEWRLRGPCYRATVAVDVNRAALAARMQSLRLPGRW